MTSLRPGFKKNKRQTTAAYGLPYKMNTQQNQQDTRLNLAVQLCILLQHLSEPSTDLCNIFALNKYTKGTRLREYQKRSGII
jgi:hypothetical protein